MSDHLVDETEAAVDEVRPSRVRVVTGTIGLVALLLLLWGATHVAIPPVHPDREAPEEHSTAPCWACHVVTEQAPLEESR